MNPEKRTLLTVRLEDCRGDGFDIYDADGRGRGEPAEVYRRERAGRAEFGRLKQRANASTFRGFVKRGIPGCEGEGATQGELQINSVVHRERMLLRQRGDPFQR